MQCLHTNKTLIPWEYSNFFLYEPDNKILYNKRWKRLDYNQDYFLDDYKSTYGKTYLEDEENIRFQSRKRLKYLRSFLKHHKSILEIGCALGFFLDESRHYFEFLEGVEISEFACNYAKNKLNLNVHCIDLISFIKTNQKKYDVIASFYVIEHFKEQKEIFSFISNSLNPGGIWIASIPSIYGPLFDYNKDLWIKTHPEDHFVDYHPFGLRRILKLYNLNLQYIRPASYHHERTKGLVKKLPNMFYKWYCNLFSYGDTVEFIAIKEK